MNLPRSIGGWLLLFTPAALLILGLLMHPLLRSIGMDWATSRQSYGLEYAIYALLLSIPLSLGLGIWIARKDRGWAVRGLIGVLTGAVVLVVNFGVAFAGCMSLSQVGILK